MRVGFAGGPLDGRKATWDNAPRSVVSTDIDPDVERVVYELCQQIEAKAGKHPTVLCSAIYLPQGTTDSAALNFIRDYFAKLIIE